MTINTQTEEREGVVTALDSAAKPTYIPMRARARKFAAQRGLRETELECVLWLGDNGYACNYSNRDLSGSRDRDDAYVKTEGMQGAEVPFIAQELEVAAPTVSQAGTRLWRDDLAVKLCGFNCRRMASDQRKVELTLTPSGAALYNDAHNFIHLEDGMKGGNE
jgi:hypothetical protein